MCVGVYVCVWVGGWWGVCGECGGVCMGMGVWVCVWVCGWVCVYVCAAFALTQRLVKAIYLPRLFYVLSRGLYTSCILFKLSYSSLSAPTLKLRVSEKCWRTHVRA